MKRIIIAIIVMLVFPGFPGQAEEMNKIPRLFGTFTPKLGVWSEYSIAEKGMEAKGTMRMAIVGQEGDNYWYEVVNKDGESVNIVKMLVSGDPNDSGNIQRLILKSGNNPAQEMPKDFVLMGRRMAMHMFEQRSGVPADTTSSLSLEKIGEETITVPAGKFKVTKNRIVDSAGKIYGTYYFSSEVYPFGIVSSESDNNVMVLMGYGNNAGSAITEEPVVMNRPLGMPEGMPRGYPPGMVKQQQQPQQKMEKQTK